MHILHADTKKNTQDPFSEFTMRYPPGSDTHSESVDSSNNGLADLGDLGPVSQEIIDVVLNELAVLHLLDIGTS